MSNNTKSDNNKSKKRKRRFFSSMSFRINMVLIIVMIGLGWSFTHVMTMIAGGISNMARMTTMARVVKTSVETTVDHVESVMMTAALSAQQKKLTSHNSYGFCDSIAQRSMEIDSVYLATADNYNKELDKCIKMSMNSSANVWSNPHYVKRYGKDSPVVTLVTPLRNPQGNIYSTLCAEVNLHWLKKIADTEQGSGEAYISITTNEDQYLYNRDSVLIMKTTGEGSFMPEDKGQGILTGDILFNTDNDGGKSNDVVSKTGWKVKVAVPLRDNNDLSIVISIFVIVMLTMLFIVIIVCIILTVNWQLRPLGKIAAAADAIANGEFNNKIPKIGGHSDISHLRDSFVTMQEQLGHYIEDLRNTTEMKAAMERDLHIASEIQKGLLPKTFPAFPERRDIDIYGMVVPAKEVGGDIFDFFMRDDKLFFLIGDVSGKGVPASLFMMVVGHLFRNVGRYINDSKIIASAINNGLAEGNEQNMFCTLFCGVLDMNTGMLDFCNAGHNAPILIHDGKAQFMQTMVNLPAGTIDDFDYQSEQMQLSDNDVLFLYTDGVTEAENRSKCLFGDNNTIGMVDMLKDVSMRDLADGTFDAVKNFADGAEQSDDITVLCLRYARGR